MLDSSRSAVTRWASPRERPTGRNPDIHEISDAPAWWLQSCEVLLSKLATSPEGLTDSEATQRRQDYGPNEVRDAGSAPLLYQFLRRFSNPLVLILLAASLISAVIGEIVSSSIIAGMVLISVTLDFVQEYRAGRAAEKLSEMVQVRSSVLRDGTTEEVPLRDVVPGDIVLLAAGTLVPADGVLLDAR